MGVSGLCLKVVLFTLTPLRACDVSASVGWGRLKLAFACLP